MMWTFKDQLYLQINLTLGSLDPLILKWNVLRGSRFCVLICSFYVDPFSCRHSGQFGTINNFRLGRLPSVPVEWNEINAAWGQTVLLLHALANKMGLRFQR